MSPAKLFSEVLHEWAAVFMHRSFRDFKRFMDEAGLSPSQVNALMRLRYGKQCGVSDVAEHLGITNAAASQMVERLVQMGLMQRTEAQDDRRVKHLTLTEAGRALVERGVDARRRWLEDLTCTLTPEQQEIIANALTMLTEAARRLSEDDAQPAAKNE
jgi:DNA-binding MarR family transcriptional regulator